MSAGSIIFAIWLLVFGYIGGMLTQLFIGSKELSETKAELKYTRKKLAEFREGISQTMTTVEVIEIKDETLKENKEENLFEPF